MKILIGCEQSGVVRRAFRARGHDAWSMDLLPSADASPHHIQADHDLHLIDLADNGTWEVGIFHPPCTRLCNSGVLRLYRGGKKVNGIDPVKWEEMKQGATFFLALWNCRIPRLCIENPVPHGHAGLPDFTQSVQPYEFGDDASKRTCLWLKGLSKLIIDPLKYVAPRWVCQCGNVFDNAYWITWRCCPACKGKSIRPRWANQTNSGQNKLAPSPERGAIRAVTYDGIAAQMAAQWTRQEAQNRLPLPA